MKQIALSKGKVALVDDEDYARVSAHKWQATRSVTGVEVGWFPRRHVWDGDKRTSERLNRFILGVTDKNVLVCMKDFDGLNCQRSNLVLCNRSQFRARARKRAAVASSNCKGVTFEKSSRSKKKWTAFVSGSRLGRFATELEAAQAYDSAARQMFGEFANTNFTVEVSKT